MLLIECDYIQQVLQHSSASETSVDCRLVISVGTPSHSDYYEATEIELVEEVYITAKMAVKIKVTFLRHYGK